MNEIQNELMTAIFEADRDRAGKILNEWGEKRGFEKAVFEVLEPVLEEIGVIWETSHNVSLAQAYVAGKISEDFMLRVAEEYNQANPAPLKKGAVIIGNIEDDYHSLGRKMVSIFLKSAGWDVIDLGNDVPAKDFVDKAEETGASFIAVSAMMYSTALNIKKVREEIDSRGLKGRIKLAAGGAVFRLRPGLLEEVGGDGTAGNAINVPALFDRLLNDLGKGL